MLGLAAETRDAHAGALLARADAALIAGRQDELLRRHVRHCAAHSPFYRRMFDRLGVKAEELQRVGDLARLPFTEKSDLECCHGEFLALPPSGIVDLCLTSGTTGKSVAMLQSAGDLDRLAYNEELSFRGVGITREDRVLVAAAIDRCFMAGLAYFLGLTRIGATVIRGGSSSTALLMELVRSCRPSAIVGVPSLLLAVAEKLQQEGVEPSGLGITRLVCIGEPIRSGDFALSPLGARLVQSWRCPVFGTYASTEMATSFTDCTAGLGGHLHPDLIAVQIVDEQGEPVPDGSLGEVVATPGRRHAADPLPDRGHRLAAPWAVSLRQELAKDRAGRGAQIPDAQVPWHHRLSPGYRLRAAGDARSPRLLHRGGKRVCPIGPDPGRGRLGRPLAERLPGRRTDRGRHPGQARGGDRPPRGGAPGDGSGRQAKTGGLL